MQSFRRGDVVRVPFPYTDGETRQHRPALVVSDGPLGLEHRLLWVVMITSARNRPWPEDVPLGSGYRAFGLPAPSVVRTSKIATIETRHADGIGRLDAQRIGQVEAALRRHLSFAAAR